MYFGFGWTPHGKSCYMKNVGNTNSRNGNTIQVNLLIDVLDVKKQDQMCVK